MNPKKTITKAKKKAPKVVPQNRPTGLHILILCLGQDEEMLCSREILESTPLTPLYTGSEDQSALDLILCSGQDEETSCSKERDPLNPLFTGSEDQSATDLILCPDEDEEMSHSKGILENSPSTLISKGSEQQSAMATEEYQKNDSLNLGIEQPTADYPYEWELFHECDSK